ncbi:MAG: four-carbon acid sugar kinase family protein [Eubacteriaceae bacterium]|nr:four-carbon acid sugar kinase family protein [Eubacteriaceae bacterium]
MPKIAVIADDLTGANATSVLLTKQGFCAMTYLDESKFNDRLNQSSDVIAISTGSRGMSEKEAYDAVVKAVSKFAEKETVLYSKRIDSTLRGNIGSEITAMLDYLKDYTAIAVPAYPASKRTCINGMLYVDNVLLEKTDAAKDAKTPVNCSDIRDIIQKQYSGDTALIDINCVNKGISYLKDRIISAKEEGLRVIVIDAADDKDIKLIAKAVKESAIKVFAVDPGPFTAALAGQLTVSKNTHTKVFLIIGSITPLTNKQVENLKKAYDTLLVNINCRNLLNKEDFEEEYEKAEKLIIQNTNSRIIGITADFAEIIDLKIQSEKLGITQEALSGLISNKIARIALSIIDKISESIRGIYTSGGDITVAVLNAFNADGIYIKNEVLPLAVYGSIINGTYDNLPIITKGGLVGDENALIRCVEYMLLRI